MVSRPMSNDATPSSGIGRDSLLPILFAPTPRRATNSSILASETEDSLDGERYDSRYPLPNTPLQYSTPSVLNQQFPLNAIPNTHGGLPSDGGNLQNSRHGHNRAGSWGSARSSVSPSSKKLARFSPNLTTNSPERIHNPLPPGATPIRSAMRQTPSPARISPQYQLPAHDQGVNSPPNITVIHPSPPSPTSPIFHTHTSPAQLSNWRTKRGGTSSDENDEGATPGQRLFRSGTSLSPTSPRRTRSPIERGSNDSGSFGSRSSVLTDSHTRIPAAQSQKQPQRTGNTTSQHNQTDAATSASRHPAASQQRSRSEFRTSWQAPRSPSICPPVIPGSSRTSTNPISPFPDPNRLHHAIPTTAGPTSRSTNTDLPRLNTSFGYPAGEHQPRSSHTRHSQRTTPHGPARTVFTPANGSGRANVDVNSVINDLLRVTPTSVTWQTHQGILSWTPHPALPGSGPNLLGGNGSRGRSGNFDGFTDGYPMPGACPTWTPGVWPPVATSTAVTSRRALIQLAPWMIPNPCNAALPHIMWDISQLPTTANRITGNHVIVSVNDKFDDIATHPAVDRLVVVCQVGVAEKFWGHIDVKASKPKGVTVWDVFNGIYEYFQKRVGRRELDRMKELLGDERLEEKMADAYYQRILTTPALPGYEQKEGLKRVDCLGDGCFFWGLYVSYNDKSTWQLNLGLVNRRRCA